jgi:hypothetical protein
MMSPRSCRVPVRLGALAGLLALVAVVTTGCQVPLGPVTKLPTIEAVRFPETSDPFVVADGGFHYLYGSNNDKRAPITRLSDIDRAYGLGEKNALSVEGMPTKPAWTASSNQLWAPTVGWFAGRWVMWFSADLANPSDPANPQCIGRAFSSSPMGPFVPEPFPIHCGIDGRGALDPNVLVDEGGRAWLLVAFGNTNTPIHSIPLDANGNLAGPPVAILGRLHPWEYWFIENPSMIYDRANRSYLLAYSAGKWFEAGYSTGIARCTSPAGPCTSDPSGPWIASSNGRTAPGGLSFFSDAQGAQRAIFSTFRAGGETTVGGRSASTMYLRTSPSVALTVVK